jgi:hypothetical protein
MDKSDLKNALNALYEARTIVRAKELEVWAALASTDPELAAEILQLFSTVEAAAAWATSDLHDSYASPADQVAEGRSADVLTWVRKAAHGFAG